MELRKETLFPTHIYIAENVLEPLQIEDLVKRLPRWPGNHQLHKEPATEALCDCIGRVADVMTEQQNWIIDSKEITGMWANLDSPGDVHLPHTHSNNMISGVFYLDAEDTSAIEFWDPRPSAHVIHPRVTQYTRHNSKVWAVPPKNNSLVMFPSWLMHYVKKNETSRVRLSMAFNLQFHGLMGDPAQLQAGHF